MDNTKIVVDIIFYSVNLADDAIRGRFVALIGGFDNVRATNCKPPFRSLSPVSIDCLVVASEECCPDTGLCTAIKIPIHKAGQYMGLRIELSSGEMCGPMGVHAMVFDELVALGCELKIRRYGE